jgi:hypothetical protein
MMKKIIILLAAWGMLSVNAFPAVRARSQGWCEQGNHTITVLGYASSTATPVQRSYPSCTVTVYITGGGVGTVNTAGTAVTWVSGTLFNPNGQWSGLTITINAVNYTIANVATTTALTLTTGAGVQAAVSYGVANAPAAIYSDDSGTALANPFVADTTGHWFFHADDGNYDVQFSGGGLSAPFTFGAVPSTDPRVLQNGTGATARLKDSKLNDVVSVKDFGAVGDGVTDDSTAFQLAVDSVSAGTTVLVPAGTYLANFTMDKAVALRLAQATITSAATSTISITASGTSISCDSYASHVANTRYVITGGINPTGNVITVGTGLSNIIIQGCSLDITTKTYFNQPVDEAAYYLGDAVYVGGSSSSRVSNVAILNNLISSGNNGVVLDDVDNCRVEGNHFANLSVSLSQLGLFGANYCSVTGNTFTDSGGIANAVYIRRSSFGSTSMLQDGNVIADNSISGMYQYESINVTNSTHSSISGNTIVISVTANNSSGIIFACGSGVAVDCVGNTATGNTVQIPISLGTSGGVAGIGVNSFGTARMIATVVSGNSVYSPGLGIGVIGLSMQTLISSNLIVQVAGSVSGTAMIVADPAVDTQVVSNTIVGSATQGIYTSGTRDIISWNKIRDSGSNGIYVAKPGGQDSTYSYNELIANSSYGIAISTPATNLIVRGNHYTSNTLGTIAGLTAANTGIHEVSPMQFDGGLGVGVAPLYPIHIKGKFNAGDPFIYGEADEYNEFRMKTASNIAGDGTVSSYAGYASRGSLAAPTIIQNGNSLVRLDGRGWDGSAYQVAGLITVVADGTPVLGDVPGKIEIWTKTQGGALIRTLSILNAGTIKFGLGITQTLASGSGTPNGVVTAVPGSLYVNTAGGVGTSLYVKETGNGDTGWVGK